MLKEKAYWILMFSFGAGVGLFTALSTLLEQILCPRGYPDVSSLISKQIGFLLQRPCITVDVEVTARYKAPVTKENYHEKLERLVLAVVCRTVWCASHRCGNCRSCHCGHHCGQNEKVRRSHESLLRLGCYQFCVLRDCKFSTN